MYQEPKCPYPYCSFALEFHLDVFFFPYEYPYQRNKSYFCATIKNDPNTNMSSFRIKVVLFLHIH